ncbi:MAG: carboxypeptidase regulatory-like domain-containing protein, partial [Anaerolineales bacterium]|nr:carboxypeptidase regulatory-like domain-containing protein [Anaerolineales bacterium]
GNPAQGIPPSILQPDTPFSQLFTGTGGLCENFSFVPIVLYDDLADRWLMAQLTFGAPFTLCVAISTTPDPTGTYYLYEFPMPAYPDYAKLSAWPDAYYIGTNSGLPHEFFAHALDRNRMLAGLSATRQSIGNLDNFVMPADLDGQIPPPPNAPGIFYTMYAEGYPDHPAGPDRLALYEFTADWAVPNHSTLTLVQELPLADFNYTVCGYLVQVCIPQPGTPQKLDSLSYWPMFRFQYRNFGPFAAMVGNFTVDANGEDLAGIRWFEVHKTGTTYSLYQEGTYAPDANHRWMGSIAMDERRNLALGYSVSGETVVPSLRYTAHLITDPPGTLAGEAEMWQGTGVQTGIERWGDYSNLVVDPVDGCHFWYTGEYHDVDDGGFGWNTRVGVFKLPGCEGDPGTVAGQVTDGASGLAGVEISARAFITQTGQTMTEATGLYSLTLPQGTYTLTATAYGYLPGVVPGVEVVSGTVTAQNLILLPAPVHTVSGTVTDAAAGWPVYAEMTISGLPQSIWTDPATGVYQVALPEGQYTFEISSWVEGYVSEMHEVFVGEDLVLDFALAVDEMCVAPGYEFNGTVERFETETLPPGWQAVDNIIRPVGEVWQFDDPMGRGNLTGGLGGFAIMDSDMFGEGEQQDSSLITPVLDFSALDSVWVAFDTDFKVYPDNATNEKAQVDVSVDGGETWQTVWVHEMEDGDFNRHVVLDISSLAAGEPEVLLQFRYYDAEWDYWWQVDNIAYGALSCDPLPGGWVVGNVYDENFQTGLNDLPITVTLPTTQTLLTSLPTPDDPGLADGFYAYFAPPGGLTLTTTAPLYGVVTHTLTIENGTTSRQDFLLPAGWLNFAPDQLVLSLGMGYSATLPLALDNLGSRPATFSMTGPPSAEAPWLFISPITGTLDAESSLDFEVVLSAISITQTGIYTANLLFENDTPYGNLNLPIALLVDHPSPSISISPNQVQMGPPGSTITYTLTITNTGNVPEWFDLHILDHLWEISAPADSIFLNPGARASLTLSVSIPTYATYLAEDVLTIQVTGALTGITASSQMTTIAQPLFVQFFPAVQNK